MKFLDSKKGEGEEEGSCKVITWQQEEVNAIERHVHIKSLQPCPTLALQAPLSMGFSRQQYWSGLPFPSVGDFPHPGIEPMSLTSPALAGRFFTTNATWELQFLRVGGIGAKRATWRSTRSGQEAEIGLRGKHRLHSFSVGKSGLDKVKQLRFG